jgi:hypothetical protein
VGESVGVLKILWAFLKKIGRNPMKTPKKNLRQKFFIRTSLANHTGLQGVKMGKVAKILNPCYTGKKHHMNF